MKNGLKKKFEKLVVSTLSQFKVEAVRLMSGVDHDGDPVLDVTIVLDEASTNRISAEAFLSVTRNIRRLMIDNDDERFPHVRFVSVAEQEPVDDL